VKTLSWTVVAACIFVVAPSARAALPQETAGSIHQYLEMQYGSVKQSPIATGILYDLALPISHIADFNGGNTAPPAGLSEWLQVAFELRHAALVPTGLPEDNILRDLGRSGNREHVYPLAFLNYRYNRIRPGIPLDSAFHIEDGNVTSMNPDAFMEERVFVAAALHATTYRGASTRFHVDLHSLYFSNDRRAPEKVEMDFDDGAGFRQVPHSGDIVIHYATTGRRLIRAQVTQSDGVRLFSEFPFDVITLTTPNPTETWDVQATIPYNGQYSTGQAYVYLSDIHDTLTNPIVVSEGFDLFNDMNWDELYALLNQQNLVETVRAMGYDAVVLNYTNATDYIEANAFLMEALLERVQQTIPPGRTISLIGPSMGGLTTRYALDYMETNAIPHHVRTWISFDSPQNGAVIPLGLQYWMQFFAPYSSSAAFLRDALNSPAAREMLLAHFTVPPSNTPGPDPLRATLVSDLAAVGGYPTMLRKVAVANGSGYGMNSGFNPGAQIILYEYSSLFVTVTGDAWALNNAASQQIFNGRYRIFPITDVQQSVTVQPTWPWDDAPGGLRNSMYQMDTSAVPVGDIIALYDNHCFIPTISSLALDMQDPFFDIANAPNLYSLTPFDSLYYPAENQDHVTITPQNLWWFISEACDSLSVPTVVISGDSSGTRLNWSPTVGAQSYRVYSTTDVNTWPSLYASTADTAWVDPNSSDLLKFYRVLATTDPATPAVAMRRH
jgi:hypothetical protein